MTYEVANKADMFKPGDRVQLGNGQLATVKKHVVSPTGFHSYRVETDQGRAEGATAPTMVRVGSRTFTCRVALTPAEHERGLQGSDPLGPSEGMLFAFEHPRAATFHMGTVSFPIDIMFIEQGRVARVIRDAQPGSKERWSYPRTDGVLEVAAGRAPEVGHRVRAAFLGGRLVTADHYGQFSMEPDDGLPPGTLPTHENIIPSVPYSEREAIFDAYDAWGDQFVPKDASKMSLGQLQTAIKDRMLAAMKPQTVPTNRLVAMQERTFGESRASGPPVVWPWGDKFAIMDGHHRAVRAILDGRSEMDVLVVPQSRAAAPLARDPQRYKVFFPEQQNDQDMHPERWEDRGTPDEVDPSADEMSPREFVDRPPYTSLGDSPATAPFRPAAQKIDDPADMIVGVIQAMSAEDRPLDWHRDALNDDLAYAMITQQDIAGWIRNLGMTSGEATEVYDAATSVEGFQTLGDGFVLAGLAKIANVATTDDGRVLVLWTEFNDVSQ